MANQRQYIQDIILRFLVDQQGILKARKILAEETKAQETKKKTGGRVVSGSGLTASGLLTDNELKKLQGVLVKGRTITKGMRQDLVAASEALQLAFAGSSEEYEKIRRQKLAEDVTAISKTMRVPLNRAVDEIITKQGMGLPGYRGAEDLRQAITEAHQEGGEIASESLREAYGKIARLGITGFTLVMTGMRLKQLGEQMISPATKGLEFYGPTSKVSAQWINATNSMSKASLRVGNLLMQELAPAVEKIAIIINKVADYVEEHPGLTKAYLGTAGAAAGIGFSALLIGQVLSSAAAFMALFQVSGLKEIMASGGLKKGFAALMTKAAPVAGPVGAAASSVGTKALTAMFTTALGSITSGITVGIGGYNLMAKVFKLQSAGEIAGKSIALLARAIGNLKSADTGTKWFLSVGKALGVIKKETEGLGPGLEATESYIEFLKEEETAEEDYMEEVKSIHREGRDALLDLERNYQKDRAKLIADASKEEVTISEEHRVKTTDRYRDLQKELNELAEDYYKKRTELARDYNVEVQEAEEDHQREMRYMLEEHNMTLDDLIAKRDALGIVREMEQYELDRSRAEEEYAVEARRRSEEFARRMSDLEAEYAAERARKTREVQARIQEDIREYNERRKLSQQQLAEQLKELDENYKLEREASIKQTEEKLAELDANYRKESERRKAAYLDQLRALDATLLKELEIRDAYYQEMSRRLVAWLESMAGAFPTDLPGYLPKKHSGGYTENRPYELQKGEFVLTPSTTSLLERLIGSTKLTQGNLISSLFSRSSGPNKLEISIKVGSNDPLSQYQAAMKQIAQQEIGSMLGG